MKVLLRHKYGDDRIAFLKARLADQWRVEDMETPDDPEALKAALEDADAVVSMSWRDSFPHPKGGSTVGAPSRHPFATLDNVIMSPHASGWSEGLLDRRWTLIADNLARLERGEPLLNLLREPGGSGPA